MNKQETIEILTTLFVAYPKIYKDFNDVDKRAVVNLWENQFKKDTYELVNRALNNLIATKIYAPTIADLKFEIDKIRREAQMLYYRHQNATTGIVLKSTDIITGEEKTEVIRNGIPLDTKTLKEVKKILGI